MKRKRITVMWVPSGNTRPLVLSVPKSVLYICLCLFVTSWVLLAIGGYLGTRLQLNADNLRLDNSRLQHKVQDLESLRQAMEIIQEDESTIRRLLGVDSAKGGGISFGQGGEPSLDPLTNDRDDVNMISWTPSSENLQSSSIVEKVQVLRSGLKELVEAMKNQKQALDSTPSIVPVKGYDYWVSSGFGWRHSPFTGAKEFHNGLDICGRRGTPVIAPANGTIFRRGRHRYMGRYLRIKHGRGITTTYGHLSEFNVKKGQEVKRGEVIAFMGNTGRSSGTHVHYSVRVNKRYVNPFHYILNTKNNRLVDARVKAGGRGE